MFLKYNFLDIIYVALVEKKIDTCILSVFDFIDHKVQAITLTCAASVFKRYHI